MGLILRLHGLEAVIIEIGYDLIKSWNNWTTIDNTEFIMIGFKLKVVDF